MTVSQIACHAAKRFSADQLSRINWVFREFETSCAAGAPLRMKKGILEVATFQREDDQQSTVSQRVKETVLWGLGEPLHVAPTARAERKSTKNTLYKDRPQLGCCRTKGGRVLNQEKGAVKMSIEVLYQRCAGIDVHQSFLVVCLSTIEAGKRRREIRTFRNETADLLALRTWLLQEKCSHVAMESTGVYTPPTMLPKIC